MSLVCAQCSRVNPAEAAYCYYDGAALSGRAGGPINAGAAPFPNPFVFPNGLSCRNFDQLAMACQQNWPSAMDLLRQGFLGSFFGGMGRVDLAMAAKEAAAFPDLERGLDLLIAKLPTQAVQQPKLQAEPTEINLGLVKIGEDRTTELHLSNLGMRLLYGTATSDAKWLLLGEGQGHAEKLFQFGAEATIPVHIRGQHLRAGTKPLEGRLTLDSNGGTVTVTFRADVPITPYNGGLFAGATTPRQVAEKAKATPKEAAPYFENGDVAKWYAANGWAYPVQGPIMSGMGSIQQFFEALGVGKPPKVDFSPKTLDLHGEVGKTIVANIEVTTPDKKVVYGWATCSEPWVEIGKTKLAGKSATVPITIRVPSPCPPTLEATIHMVGNGNQKKDIPLKIKVAGGKAGVKLKREEEVVNLEIVEEAAPLAVSVVEDEAPVATRAPAPVPIDIVDLPPSPATAAVAAPPVEVVHEPVAVEEEESPFSISDGPMSSTPGSTLSSKTKIPQATGGLPLIARLVIHFVPFCLLGCCLFGLIGSDVFLPVPKTNRSGGLVEEKVTGSPLIKIEFDEGQRDRDYSDSMNFAVHKLNDPKNPKSGSVKLNWYPNGSGNSIVAMIDGHEAVFGEIPGAGKWYRDKEHDYAKGGVAVGEYGGKKRTFEFTKQGILVTQTVTIEPSDPVEVAPGDYQRLLTTCLVRYRIHNSDKNIHKVGLRVMMDTCIGDKDDVPFILPGVAEPITTKKHLIGGEVPSFVQVIEKTSMRDPGIVLQLGLRFNERLDPPDRFLLTRYPGKEGKLHQKWKVAYEDFRDDSCVVIYWDPRDLSPGKSRDVAFTYGLGSISAEGDRLGLTVGGSFQVNGELTVVALVSDKAAKTATLKLPPGMSLSGKEKLTQDVPPIRADRAVPVTWKVRANTSGSRQEITVSTDTGLRTMRRVTISERPLFGG